MRINCVNLSEYHMYKYRRYKQYLLFFRIPVIVLSGANVFSAVGLQNYMSQANISIINSIISLFCGIVTSVELFLNIQKKMETDLVSHKNYYRLSVDIFKVISLEEKVRKVDGKTFLDQKFSEYEKLIESSNVFDSEYIFDTLSSQVPIVTDVKLDPMALTKYKSMYSRIRFPKVHTSESLNHRLNYIRAHRDNTAEFFYKDLHTATIKEFTASEIQEQNEIYARQRQQKELASAAAKQAILMFNNDKKHARNQRDEPSADITIRGGLTNAFRAAAGSLLPSLHSTSSTEKQPNNFVKPTSETQQNPDIGEPEHLVITMDLESQTSESTIQPNATPK